MCSKEIKPMKAGVQVASLQRISKSSFNGNTLGFLLAYLHTCHSYDASYLKRTRNLLLMPIKVISEKEYTRLIEQSSSVIGNFKC